MGNGWFWKAVSDGLIYWPPPRTGEVTRGAVWLAFPRRFLYTRSHSTGGFSWSLLQGIAPVVKASAFAQ
jgi:hypothetical protein